uniref:SWIM-type domain-containing protein n=1 Tax=Setaria italica TaxID=4555 RepID=K3XRE7_SETIT
MNEVVELFDARPSFKDLVDRAMRKYGCGVDEMTLRGRFDCWKVRPHCVRMNLAFESNWKQYKEVVEHANVVCLEVVVDICPRPSANVALRDEVQLVVENGTQESTISQHGLGESQSDFGLAIANDEFSNDIFEREEANIDGDDISLGSKDDDFEEKDGAEDVQANTHEDVGVRDRPESVEGMSCRTPIRSLSMIHKAICESTMVNSEGIPYSENLVIKKGMKFNSFEKLKFLLADYAVRLHRLFSVIHSDKNLRYDVMCKQGCTGQWRISKIVQPHTCRSSQPKRVHAQCTATGYRVKYLKAWRAKQHAIALLWGDWKESYGMVPRVLIVMAYYNPGIKWFPHTSGMMQPDNGIFKHVLQRVFCCFPQCRVSFQHCHPVILVNTTLLTGKYKGTLMMVVAVDPEQQLVPLTFALAERENNDSWSWFMKLVCRYVLRPSRQVVHEALCANMWRRQKNKEVIGKLKVLCMVHTEKEFDKKLEDFVKDLNDEAKQWLKGEMEDKDKWLQAFDEGGMRYGIMTTNYSESLNNVFKCIRSRPAARIIEYSFQTCNAYFVDRWQKARDLLNEGHRNGKVADDYISDAELRSVNQLPESYELERMVYCVRGTGSTNIGCESHGGRNYRVDLNEGSCSCKVPQLLHLPCSHLITTCKARGLNFESPMYMSPLYSRKHTIKIWESSFESYLDPSQ